MDKPEDTQPESFKPSCENFAEYPVDDTQVAKDPNTTFGYIYKIQFPNGKNYIGLTTSLERRTKQHKKCAKNGDIKLIYKALRKYDMVDSFELVEIDTAITLEELCEKEIRYILEYNSYYGDGYGYNMTRGGEGVNGYVFTEEDKLKNSEAHKKYYAEHSGARELVSLSMNIYYAAHPESREKLSKSQIKRFENPEAREKCSKSQIKRFENPESREKCSKSQIKRFENPEARELIGASMKKYNLEHPEARVKNSEALKKYFENTKAREHISEKIKQYHQNNPDIKYINNETQKKYYQDNPTARRKLSDGKGKNKPFDIFTVDGTFIKTFCYQFEAIEYLQREHHITSKINISGILLGNGSSSAGFVFKYKTI